MVSLPDQQISVVMIHYDSFAYTSNRCPFDTQYFYYFNSFPMIPTSKKIGRPRSLVFKCFFFFEIVYGLIGLIGFCNRYKLSFVAYLSISVLISSPHKMPQPLDLPFYFILSYSRESLVSQPKVTIFYGTIFLGSFNSLINSNRGVSLHWEIMIGESFF